MKGSRGNDSSTFTTRVALEGLRGDAPLAAAGAGTGEDVEGEPAAHQRDPGPRPPRVPAEAGLELARGGVGGGAAGADGLRAPARMRGKDAGVEVDTAVIAWGVPPADGRKG